MSKKPLVSVIIVNYNGKDLLEECLTSLYNLDYPKKKMEIFVVDNCSKDDSIDFVKNNFKKVKIIKNKENNYCKANNLGINACKGEFVALLNNDVIVKENWLKELVKVIREDPQVGVACGKALGEDNKIQNAGLLPLPNFYWQERGAGKKDDLLNQTERVPAVSNIATLYRKECFREVGGLDEDFRMYYEDVDITKSIKDSGWELVFVPDSKVYHKLHGTATKELSKFYIERNRLLFVAKHFPEKLSNALVGSGYFTSKEEKTGEIFTILSDVICKLYKSHKFKEAEKFTKDLLEEVEKIVNYENILLDKKLLQSHEKLIETKEEIKQKVQETEEAKRKEERNQLELESYKDEIEYKRGELSDLKEKNIKKSNELYEAKENEQRLEQELKDYKEELGSEKKKRYEVEEKKEFFKTELNKLSEELREKLGEILIKKGELIEKEEKIERISTKLEKYESRTNRLNNKIEKLNKKVYAKETELSNKEEKLNEKSSQIKELREELESIYNSEGYRFVLRPLWWAIFNIRKILKLIFQKIISFTQKFFSILYLPFYALLSIFLVVEELLWKVSNIFKFKKGERKEVKTSNFTVSLVIPNWNGKAYLEKCLPAVFKAKGFKNGENEVIVVDDCSNDRSVEYVREKFPEVKVIENRKNRKFGYTCNRGVKEAEGDLIVLINNDVIVTEEFLQPLKEHFKNKKVFAVSPKSYGWDKETFNFGMHMGRFEQGYVRFWNECETENEKEIYQTAPSLIAVGGAMAFRKKDFLWLGGFDSIYKPNSWEDIDISYRAWKRGLKVLYEPDSIVYHKDAATVTYDRQKEIKNELLFIWKNVTDWKILRKHLSFFSWYFSLDNISFCKGLLWALRFLPQALLHKLGERKYIVEKDELVIDRCMNYYRNFERRNFTHLSSNEKRNVLLVTPFMPYPLNMGGKIRIHTLAKLLKDKYNIILLTLINFKQEEEYTPELKEVFDEVYTIYHTSTIPTLFPSKYRYSYSEDLINKFNDIQKEFPLDIVHLESNELLYLCEYAKHLPIVYTEHDISIMSFKNSYYKFDGENLVREFYDYLKRVNYHYANYQNVNKVISLSRKDHQDIKNLLPHKEVSYIPTGTDIEHFSFNYGRGENELVYVGHYEHYPNEEAVLFFAKKIFPRIRKAYPNVKFIIVGSHPTSEVKNLSHYPGVKVIGEVPDVSPFLYKADVFVNPTRRSAGIKGKVLEAMACGTPVVSTSQGAWGLDVQPGEEILIADNSHRFAKEVIRLLKDKSLHRKIACKARKVVEEKYNWRKITSYLDKAYKDIISKYGFKNRVIERSKKKGDSERGNEIIDVYDFKDKSAKILSDFTPLLIKVKNYVEEKIDEGYLQRPEFGPEELHLELTYNCQSKCIMCDVWDYEKRADDSRKELSLEEIKRTVQESSYLKNIKDIIITGGEPFLRGDLVDLCNFLTSEYPYVGINILTNMVDTNKVLTKTSQIINKCTPTQLWLSTSLDGIGQKHDEIRRHQGAFEKVQETIYQCRKNFSEIKIAATFTITPYNINHFSEVREYCQKKNMDFFAQFSVPKEVREDFNYSKEQLQGLQSEVEKIINEIIGEEGFHEIKRKPEKLAQLYYWSHFIPYQKYPQRFLKKCVAGAKFAIFSPYGELSFCPPLKNKVVGNIRENKFDKIWMSDDANKIRNFISRRKCHCWLLCSVYPVLKEVLEKEVKKVEGKVKELEFVKYDKNFIEEERGKFSEINSKNNKKEFEKEKIILNSYPQELGIGTHAPCNANCNFCQDGDFPFFSVEIYKKFIEPKLAHVLPRVKRVNFCGYGEILLLPDVEDFLEYLNTTLSKKEKIITTNGIPFNHSIFKLVQESNYIFQVSLHSSNQRLHKKITKTKKFNKVIKNIKKLVDIRENYNKNIKIYLKSTLTTLNLEDLPNLVKLASKLGVDGVECNHITIYNKAHLKLSCFFQKGLTNNIFKEAEEEASYNELLLKLPPKFNQSSYENSRCSDPWNYFYVETQGSVTPCCFAAEHIGYLNRDSFDSIWNGQEYRSLRGNLINSDKNGICDCCYKNNPNNINNLKSHVSFRPGVSKEVLHEQTGK